MEYKIVILCILQSTGTYQSSLKKKNRVELSILELDIVDYTRERTEKKKVEWSINVQNTLEFIRMEYITVEGSIKEQNREEYSRLEYIIIELNRVERYKSEE